MVGIYVTLVTIIAYECFKLVFVLPERVMNWASASIQNYGEGDTLNQQKASHGSAKSTGQGMASTHGQASGKATDMRQKFLDDQKKK